MAQKESTFLNMTLTLFLVTAVAAVALGFVYKFTKEPIDNAKQEKLKAAINIVVPGADQGEVEEFIVPCPDGGDDLVFYKISVGGEIIGTAVKSYSTKAFSGEIIIMVGFDANGVIIDNNVLEHHETPGLGDKTAKSVSDWNSQFMGQDPASYKLNVTKDGGDVNAITAATISSRAYCDAVDRAYRAYMIYAGGESTEEPVEEENLQNEDSNTTENIGGNE